jgi:hypothetical protein
VKSSFGVVEFHPNDNLSRQGLAEIASKIRSIEEDASLISYALANIQRNKIEIQNSPPSDLRDLKMKKIAKLEARILQYRGRIDQDLGVIGQDMSAIAMIKNIKMAQLADIADDIEMVNPGLAKKLRGSLDRGISSVDDMGDLTQTEVAQIRQALKETPMALMSRGIKPPGYARQASGYAGKPLSLKMKSNPETGFIPYRTEFTSKVDPSKPKDVYTFQKYSDEAINTIQKDGLPTSVKVPRTQTLLVRKQSGVMEETTVYEVSIVSSDGKRQTSWMSDEEIKAYPPEFSVEKIEYHADPRCMPQSTPELLKKWQETQPYSPSAQKEAEAKGEETTPAQDQVEAYAEFLRKETNAKVDINLSSLYVADIDLASMATKKSQPKEEIIDLMDRGQGYISKSHENLTKYKDNGFLWLGMREQIRHGSEFNNRDFPQRAAGDYPFTIVYIDKEGVSHVKVVEKSDSTDNPHEVLFREIQTINKETGLTLLTNPADIAVNPKDYENLADLFSPAQKEAVSGYLEDLEKKGKTVGNKTPTELRAELKWALPD